MEKNKLPNNYFPHDFNARVDRKILRCRKVLGIEGYGIYWMLIETLCLQENFSYPLKDIDLLADDFGCSVEKVEAVVKQFELFQVDKDAKFFSLSLIARMQKYLELSEKARNSVNVRWDKARKLKELQQNNTTVLQPYNEGNTIKEKNIKEEKKIEEKIMVGERELVIKDYFINLLPIDAEQSFIIAWCEWVDFRKEIKKKLTTSTAIKQITFLLNQPNPIKCINQSIQNGWTGLFEVSQKQAGKIVQNEYTYQELNEMSKTMSKEERIKFWDKYEIQENKKWKLK